jgi:cytochrome P450
VQRFYPTPGPGGLVGAALSHVLGADATNVIHVTRYLDVMEVLERDDDFSVRIYDEKMTATTGPFYLGMNELPRYLPEARILQGAVRRTDAELVRRIAAEETARALDLVRKKGVIDVVQDLADIVPIRFVMRYYGIQYPDPNKLLRLFQTTSKYLFAFWSNPGMLDEACTAGREIREILDEQIRRRRQEGNSEDRDIIGRLLSLKETFSDGDAGIARSVAGLASGNLNAPLGLLVLSVDKLMSLADAEIATLQEIARGAASGQASERERFRDYVYEAERFNVYPPFSYRYAERDTTLARGASREKVIRKGSTVVTWQSLAAFDPHSFDAPFAFAPGRPKWQYMGFGHGRHRCLGEHIGQIVLEEMAQGLFRLPRLRRAAGKAGTVQFLPIQAGRYASSFRLEFDKLT